MGDYTVFGWLHGDIAMLHLDNEFYRSIRTVDLDLWVHYLPKITIPFLCYI